jgi:probable HAF family extracellular repeat protein
MRVMGILAATMWVGVLLSAASFANAATTYTFDQFDVPGSTQTTPFGINDTGQIVGFFNDSTGTHGFLFAPRRDDGGHDRHAGNSSFTTIDVPGAFTTEARGINTAGRIVGFFLEGLFGPEHGFLFISRRDDGEHDKHAGDGSFTQIDVPGVPGNTAVLDINNVAQIVGGFGDSTGGHGFVDTRGSFTAFDVPGAQSTDGSGINDAGQIVGTFNVPPPPTGGAARNHGFFRDSNGTLTTIEVPGAVDESAGGINNAGQIVGSFDADVSLQHTHGFVRYTNGTFIQLDVPGAMKTSASGINDTGQIVGAFVDSAGEHGFLATPVFRGTPGKANCHGKSVSALARQYGGLNAAAAALGFPSVRALQNAILTFCGE